MLTIYNKVTGEEISCEDKEQMNLMLKNNDNFVKTKKEVGQKPVASSETTVSPKPKTRRTAVNK